MEDQTTERRSLLDRFVAGDGTKTDRANNRRMTQLSLVWAGAILVATWLLVEVPLPAGAKWVVALLPNLPAFFVLRSYLRMLRMTDDMLRRVHLEGLAVGFGTGYFFIIGYMLAQTAGAPPLNLAILVLLMTVGWLYGNFRALRYYR